VTRSLPLYLLTAALLSTTGCNASFPPQPTTPAPITALAVRFPRFGSRFVVGDFVTGFDAYTVDADGVYTTVSQRAQWSSSNSAALVPSSASTLPGAFFVAGAGTVDAHAMYQGLVGSLTVPVRNNPPFPYLRISVFGIESAPTVRVELVLGPAVNVSQDVTTQVTWSSSNSSVAVVQLGQVRFGVPGNVELRASYNGLSDSYWLSAPPRR
jgi:hypothetical protein